MFVSIASLSATLLFAIFILINIIPGIYFFGTVIALCFILLIYSFLCLTGSEEKALLVFALIIAIIHFINDLLSYSLFLDDSDFQFNIFINYEFLGYLLKSLAFIFIGVSLKIKSKKDKLLQKMMFIHSFFCVFFILNLVFLLFNNPINMLTNAGNIIMLLWCFYFMLVNLLCLRHFRQNNYTNV